jgi:hypothetical protein
MAPATVVDVCISSATLVGPEPAAIVDGVIVAVAPVGKPLTVNVTAAGKVVPPDGPNASMYVATPPRVTVWAGAAAPAALDTASVKSCTFSETDAVAA